MQSKASFCCCCVLVLVAALHSAQQEDCIVLGQQMIGACQEEIAAMAPTYPLSAPAPATDEQHSTALASLEAAGLPTPRCCDVVQAFAEAACRGDPAVATALPSIGFTPAGLNSTLAILEDQEACA